MKVVYIAGRYRAPTPWGVEQNIQAAQAVAALVWQAGHIALCPHLNAAHLDGAHTDEQVLAGTMELLRRCDAVLLVPGWSTSAGTKAELVEAHRIGLPVFGAAGVDIDISVQQLVAWASTPHPRGDGEPREG